MTSRDHGATWTVGTPAYSGGSECQAVQLGDGSIMLNMRNEHDRYRAVFVTRDLGKTWQPHATNRKTLIEPNCNGSLLRVDYTEAGAKKHVLLFANPHSQKGRTHQTIQVSFDDGRTWPRGAPPAARRGPRRRLPEPDPHRRPPRRHRLRGEPGAPDFSSFLARRVVAAVAMFSRREFLSATPLLLGAAPPSPDPALYSTCPGARQAIHCPTSLLAFIDAPGGRFHLRGALHCSRSDLRSFRA